ncbi:transglutaminase domain-containing protein [Aquirufa sp. HETE-83D]|uniref:Transglutaminase domain-containing protein n=1 Tax=Aquirufa esocilacus TaxID=3096513 RepID=A0ABW6DNA0_9BACT
MSKTILFFLLFLFPSFLLNAQYEDYQVDSIVIHKQYKQKTVVGLSNEIAKDFEDRRCILRAFYIYITYNMKYDVKAGNESQRRMEMYYSEGNIRKGDEQEMETLLKINKGVCWHFGTLFAKLCAVQGIDVELITGTRRGLELPETLTANHLWNAVEIDGEMKMIECTINSTLPYNKEDYDELFLVDPEVFIYSSIPLDPAKQYLEKPINYAAFKRLVWPSTMFNLLQVKELAPSFKYIKPRRDGSAQINFKLGDFRQIDYIEVFQNNRLIKSIPVKKAAISFTLPITTKGELSIQTVKIKNGYRYQHYLLDYEVM